MKVNGKESSRKSQIAVLDIKEPRSGKSSPADSFLALLATLSEAAPGALDTPTKPRRKK